MADLYDENNLRVVRLQIVDEITGEPLDYVNVRTNAASVNFSNGEFLEDAFRALVKSVNTLKVDTTKQRNDFDEHILHGGHVIADRIDNAIIDTKWNQKTGVITFYRYDGTSYEWDTGLEKIPMTIDFDKTTNEIVFALDGGGETRVNISKLVDIFTGVETTHVKTTVSKDNQIKVEIKDDGIQKSYLDKEIRDILDDSVRFNEAYEDKIKGIEEEANKYILPTATDKILGGIKIGKNINIDKDGAITAGNVLYGESKDTAEPVNLFLQIDSIGGPSTDPIPTLEDATSYIVSDGNIVNFMSTDATYEFITTTDGSVESGLTKDEVEAKFYPGVELVNKADITWYNNGIYNYAVTRSGDGFVYQKDAWIFENYIETDEFIDLLNSGTLADGVWVYQPPTNPDDSGSSTEKPSDGDGSGSKEENGGSTNESEDAGSGGTGAGESGSTESGGNSETESGSGESSGGTTGEESGSGTNTDNTESGNETGGGSSESTGGESGSGESESPTESGGSTDETTQGNDSSSGADTGGSSEELSGGTTEGGESNSGTESGTDTGGETGGTGAGESGSIDSGTVSGGTESGSGSDTTGTGEESGSNSGSGESGSESGGTESGGAESGTETGGETTGEEVEGSNGDQVDLGPGGTNPDDSNTTEQEESEETIVDNGPVENM